MTETTGVSTRGLVDTGLVMAHGLAAMATLLVAVTFGILVSLQFIAPDLTGDWLPLGWGRLRYAHTQGIMFGWLGNAFLAFLYHGVPILTGRPVRSRRLGIALFLTWNFAVILPGWGLVLSGVSQPLEWAEFPLIVDLFTVIALGMAGLQFLPSFFQRSLDKLYVSSWYIIGSLVFTLLAFPMGNLVPEFVAGAAGAAISGLWIHDAVGLFVTPLALAILYFVIPASTGRPVFSHFLSMLGFWGLFFFYPLNGTHHYIFSVIPMEAQAGAIAASALLGVVVVIVVTNLVLSQRGAGFIPRDPGLRFVSMSVVFYLIVSLQGASQAQMAINQTIHFTDWVVAHSHLAMLGFATFAGIGGIVHAWQRMPDARYNARAIDWAYWLLVGGITLMFADLTIAGVIQGRLWQSDLPWLESVRASRPYWVVRSLSAIPVAGGFIALLVGLTTGPRGAGALALQPPAARDTEVSPRHVGNGSAAPNRGRGLVMSYVVASVAGVLFFGMSVALLGFWPARVLSEQTAALAPEYPLPLTAAERRGRDVYAREGCAYCHTQQVRFLQADIDRFGAPTLAWETQFDVPHMMGTRRVGPDLSRTAGTRTGEWHYLHLYAPRTVVPTSIMPSYAALFDGAPDRPTRDASDLVAYLETLGRARELAYPDADRAGAGKAGTDRWMQMAFSSPVLNAHPARPAQRGTPVGFGGGGPGSNGRQLWLDHCAGCHGIEGRGDGPAAQWLRPNPTDLTAREYAPAYLRDVLWNGIGGTSMPAWRDQSAEHLVTLASVVQSFAAGGGGTAMSADSIELGARVYARHCAECHGESGAGDGFAAGQWPVLPADFRGKRPTREEAERILREGVPGTSMAPWTDRLSDDEIAAVAGYLRRFFEGDGYRPGAAP